MREGQRQVMSEDVRVAYSPAKKYFHGGVLKWLKREVLKTSRAVLSRRVGSNPTASASIESELISTNKDITLDI